MTFALWHIALAATSCFLMGFILGVYANVEKHDTRMINELRRKNKEKEIARKLLTGSI
jgi:hypothetical protein